jgi:hypothetical protein
VAEEVAQAAQGAVAPAEAKAEGWVGVAEEEQAAAGAPARVAQEAEAGEEEAAEGEEEEAGAEAEAGEEVAEEPARAVAGEEASRRCSAEWCSQ